jgi:hypothetical protein
VVRLLVDVIVLLGVNICELTKSEYIKYSASTNKGCGDVDGGGGGIIKRKGFGPWESIILPTSSRVATVIK